MYNSGAMAAGKNERMRKAELAPPVSSHEAVNRSLQSVPFLARRRGREHGRGWRWLAAAAVPSARRVPGLQREREAAEQEELAS